MVKFPGKRIYRDDRQSTNYNKICSASIDQSLKTLTFIILVFSVCSDGVMYGVFYGIFINGTHTTLYMVRLPFLVDKPNVEFIVNLCWETIFSLMGVIGLFAIEMLFTFINDTITVSSKLCVAELGDLSDHVARKTKNINQIRFDMRKIFMKIKIMDGLVF